LGLLVLATGGLALQLLPLGVLLLQFLQLVLGILQPELCGVELFPQTLLPGQRILQLGDFLLQCRDLAGGAVGSPGVQLLFQPLIALGVGGVLLASGDQSSDAALQLGVLIHRQSVLTDEGAAQKHLPWNAQQILTGLGGGDAGDGVGGAGVGEMGVPHGGGGPSGLPQEGIAGVAVPQQ